MFEQRTVFHISGLPTTGKSTLITALKEKEVEPSVLFVPEFFDRIPDYVIQADLSDFEGKCKAQRWIIDQNKRKNQLISDSNAKLIVAERGIIDALAFSYALGNKVYQDSLLYAETEEWLGGITIFLIAHENIIKNRLSLRDGVTEDMWENYWKPYLTRVLTGYKQTKKTMNRERFIYLNTEKEEEQSVSEIIRLIATIQLILSR